MVGPTPLIEYFRAFKALVSAMHNCTHSSKLIVQTRPKRWTPCSAGRAPLAGFVHHLHRCTDGGRGRSLPHRGTSGIEVPDCIGQVEFRCSLRGCWSLPLAGERSSASAERGEAFGSSIVDVESANARDDLVDVIKLPLCLRQGRNTLTPERRTRTSACPAVAPSCAAPAEGARTFFGIMLWIHCRFCSARLGEPSFRRRSTEGRWRASHHSVLFSVGL